jgi:hypothetical protein
MKRIKERKKTFPVKLHRALPLVQVTYLGTENRLAIILHTYKYKYLFNDAVCMASDKRVTDELEGSLKEAAVIQLTYCHAFGGCDY